MTTKDAQTTRRLISEAVADLIPLGYTMSFHITKEEDYQTPQQIAAKNIQVLTCQFFGKTPDDILVKDRRFEITIIRKMLCSMLKKYTSLILKDIARLAGYGDDHTNVINAIDILDNLTFTDRNIREQYSTLDNFILSNMSFK